MKSFSLTYPSTRKKEGKTSGRWKTVRRRKTFITVITPFDEKPKKNVSFENDSENIRKPKPTKIATYIKFTAPRILQIKTSEEIEKEDLSAAMEFLAKKRKIGKRKWVPSCIRKETKTQTDDEAFAELSFNPLNVENLNNQ